MRCRQCEYPLWNLPPGSCPECGGGFRPGDFVFKIGEVRFCCPHCDQAYYGDTADGLLDPADFDCVECGTRITQDECVIRPLVGKDGIENAVAPWFDASRGIFKRTLLTAGWAMVRPGDLARGIPPKSGPLPGFQFLAMINLLLLCFGVLPIFVVAVAVPIWQGALNAGGGPGLALAAFYIGMMGVTTVTSTLLTVVAIAAAGHLVLRLTGPVQDGIGRTMSLACFGCGPAILVAIPCLGPYCGSQVSGIWSLVAIILLLSAGQRVSGLRASFAVLLMPVLLLFAIIVLTIVSGMSATTARMTMPPPRPAATAIPTESIGSVDARERNVERIVRELLPELSASSDPAALLRIELAERLRDLDPPLRDPFDFQIISVSQGGCINLNGGDLWLTVVPAPSGEASSKAVIGIRSDPADPDRIAVIVIDGKDRIRLHVEATDFLETLVSKLAFLGLGVESPVDPMLVDRWLAGASATERPDLTGGS